MQIKIFLSSDGKHTVQADADLPEADEALDKAEEMYDKILKKYGTKQEQAVKAYAADPNRDPTFTPAPARWLEEERWADDPLPPRKLAPNELREAELAKAKQRDEEERRRSQEAIRIEQEHREKAVPIPDEVKKRLLEQWARNVYPRP